MHAALVCAVILITMLNAYVRTVTIISSLVIKLRIIHGILVHKIVEEPAESKKEETFAMPRHRKYDIDITEVRLLSTTLSESVNWPRFQSRGRYIVSMS